ncbi:histidine phosphatase family protein [Bacillus tianshenii]|uniref:histidine phosphatase family protein n=1 Tax=Sutcliffiella tianshenii TaxID=1463404 RepID=UPI001CD207EB|nr:histidine phosphatase family protein [Bacillus tianshenii]MCA1318657.1 histidine phosphatase family protein [Bacillus tianshenii]
MDKVKYYISIYRGDGTGMLTLYITRHGETVWNTEKKLQGWKDSELTENGKRNARLLGERLKEVDFTAVYSSPSQRTLATAELILGDKQIAILQDENLREINMGDWEGQTHDFLKETYPQAYQAFWNTPDLYRPESGESFEQLGSRVVYFLERLKREQADGNVLIVTHTVFIKALLLHMKKLQLENFWEGAYIHDTCLTMIELSDNEINILLEGDVSHRGEVTFH